MVVTQDSRGLRVPVVPGPSISGAPSFFETRICISIWPVQRAQSQAKSGDSNPSEALVDPIEAIEM